MLAVEHIQPAPPPLNTELPEVNATTEQTIVVPRDVMSKFEAVPITGSIEEVISNKLKEEDRDKEEAFYIIDLGAVLRKYDQWVRSLPRVKPFYAIKCNPNTAIVKTLASLGVNFDCASKAEIQQILGSGVEASRIIYANPTKMKGHINYAKSVGVELMTFDNKDELNKIAECYPEAKLVLRIITDDSQSVCRFSTKFGAPLTVCSGLLSHAKALGLNVVGISFHVGSGCMSVTSFEQAIRSAYKIFQEAEQIGYNFTMLDLGGGWPGTEDGKVSFTEIATHIRPILDELFPQTVEIIAEPGRYFVAQSHTLAVNVFAKRVMEQPGEGKSFLYYVNDGVYQSFNCIFFDHIHPTPLVFDEKERTSSHRCTIFGPTCDSMDCLPRTSTFQSSRSENGCTLRTWVPTLLPLLPHSMDSSHLQQPTTLSHACK